MSRLSVRDAAAVAKSKFSGFERVRFALAVPFLFVGTRLLPSSFRDEVGAEIEIESVSDAEGEED